MFPATHPRRSHNLPLREGSIFPATTLNPKEIQMADVNTVAKVLNLTPRRVQALANEPGCPAKIGPGEYDLPKFTLWYLRYLQMELERRGSINGPESPEMRAARLSLVHEQFVSIQMENRVARGELVEMADVRDVVVRKLSNLKHRMRAIPNGLGPTLVNKSQAYCVDRIRIAVDLALAELDGAIP
jgi:phage terminase Nu1 subunit (DNA packaging protein)